MSKLILVLMTVMFMLGQGVKGQTITGDTLGQTATDTLSLFAPGIISKEFQELNAAFSPDGDTFLWTIADPNRQHYVIMQYVRENNHWSGPKVAPFSGKYSDADPIFSPDGKRIYFISKRPLNKGTTEKKDFDIWYVEKIGDRWSDAINIGTPINTEHNEYYVSVTADGSIVYSGNYTKGFGGGDIYMARPTDAGYVVENMGKKINSKYGEGDPYITPDGNTLIFTAWGRPEGLGSGDIYISFKKKGVWSKAKNLGAPFNTSAFEYCPIMSPDGQYFFLTSYRSPSLVSTEQKSYEEYVEKLSSITNGMGNIYWIKASSLKNYRD